MTRRRDPVTSDLRERVLERDQWKCVAPRLGATDPCKTVWGSRQVLSSTLQLDHVKSEPRMGRRAESDEWHLVTVCAFHHATWATGRRPELRLYLASFRVAA